MNGFSLIPYFLMPSEDGGYFYLPIISSFSQFPQISYSSYAPAYNTPTPQTDYYTQNDTPSESLKPSITSTEEALPGICSYFEKS
jgi:hypothetical protein